MMRAAIRLFPSTQTATAIGISGRHIAGHGVVMITYVTIQVSSEGEKASEITKRFKELGFEATMGSHDFAYKWKDKDVTPEMVINFVDKVQSKLTGCGIMMHFATVR